MVDKFSVWHAVTPATYYFGTCTMKPTDESHRRTSRNNCKGPVVDHEPGSVICCCYINNILYNVLLDTNGEIVERVLEGAEL